MIVVRVTPAPDMRRAFAEWAVEQTPKVRTISSRSFAVPPRLFTALPEYLLIGAMVDGHQYVPAGPEPDAEPEQAAVLPERECSAKCAGHLPLLPTEAYPPDAVLLDLVAEDTDQPPPSEVPGAPVADDDEPDEAEPASTPEAAADGHPCPDPLCGRIFDTARGLATHRRQAHAENED